MLEALKTPEDVRNARAKRRDSLVGFLQLLNLVIHVYLHNKISSKGNEEYWVNCLVILVFVTLYAVFNGQDVSLTC